MSPGATLTPPSHSGRGWALPQSLTGTQVAHHSQGRCCTQHATLSPHWASGSTRGPCTLEGSRASQTRRGLLGGMLHQHSPGRALGEQAQAPPLERSAARVPSRPGGVLRTGAGSSPCFCPFRKQSLRARPRGPGEDHRRQVPGQWLSGSLGALTALADCRPPRLDAPQLGARKRPGGLRSPLPASLGASPGGSWGRVECHIKG